MADFLQLAATAGVGAVISTIPIGPINIWLLSLALSKRHWHWWSATIGVVVADCTVAIGSLVINDMVQDTEFLQSAFQWVYARPIIDILIASILMAIGVSMIRRNKRVDWNKQADHGSVARGSTRSIGLAFAMGFIATIAEPGLATYWLAWWLKFFDPSIDLNIFVFSIVTAAVVAGDVLVFFSYRFFVVKLANRLTPKNFARIEFIVGIILLAGASLLLLSSFHKILRGFYI